MVARRRNHALTPGADPDQDFRRFAVWGGALDIFLLSALFAAAVSLVLLVAEIRIAGEKVWAKVGNKFRFIIARRTLNLIIVTFATLIILVVLMVALGNFHPRDGAVYRFAEFLLGRRFGSIVLGFLFGALLVFWMRQLLALDPNDPKQQVTWVHKAEAIFLVVLLLFGGFSDVINFYARRVTQFSAAGVSLTFESTKGAAGSGQGQQGSGGTAAAGAGNKQAGSFSLSIFSDIQGFIERDRRYIAILNNAVRPVGGGTGKSSDAPLAAATESATAAQQEFFSGAVRRLGLCMQAISSTVGDEGDVDQAIQATRPIIREFVNAGHTIEQNRLRAAANQFVDISASLADAAVRVHLRKSGDDVGRAKIDEGCRDLVAWWCPEMAGLTLKSDFDFTRFLDRWDRCPIVEPAAKAARQSQAAELSGKLVATLVVALGDSNASSRPYLSLLYASLLWRAGEYRLAAGVLEQWIKLSSGKSGLTQSWYLVRVRTTLVVILEEWIRATVNSPPLLLEQHLANVKSTMDMMGEFQAVKDVWVAFTKDGYSPDKDKYQRAPEWSEFSCAIPRDADQAFRISLAHTYLTQHMIYAFRTTQHRDYFDKYSPAVLQRRDTLAKVNLACYQQIQERAATDIFYAEIMQVCADVDLANAARIAETAADTARPMLEGARDAALLGLKILRPYLDAERKSLGETAFEATKPRKLFEVQEQLFRVRDQAMEGLRKT